MCVSICIHIYTRKGTFWRPNFYGVVKKSLESIFGHSHQMLIGLIMFGIFSITWLRSWRSTKIAMFHLFFGATSSTAQGGGGSFKNRKPIGEVGCCESGMAKRIHWWIERCLISLTLSLSFSAYLPTYLLTYLPTYLSLSLYLSVCLSVYLSIYLSMSLPIYFSICLDV